MQRLMEARQDMRELLQRTMPGVGYDMAWNEVMRWWKVDEPARRAAKVAP